MTLNESGKVDLVKIAELLRIVARHCEEGNAELLRVTDELSDLRAELDRYSDVVGPACHELRRVTNELENI